MLAILMLMLNIQMLKVATLELPGRNQTKGRMVYSELKGRQR